MTVVWEVDEEWSGWLGKGIKEKSHKVLKGTLRDYVCMLWGDGEYKTQIMRLALPLMR